MIRSAALMVALGMASPSHAQIAAGTAPTFDKLVSDYVVCIRTFAARIEAGGDSPENVADAARFMCSDQAVGIANFQIQNPSPSNQIGGGIDGTAKFFGTAQAVIARYCRKGGDCVPGAYGLLTPRLRAPPPQ